MSSFKCQIFYDNPSGLYYAGQTLTGRVEYTAFEEIKLRSLYVKIMGHSQTYWAESTYPTVRKCRTYENYLNIRGFILGSRNGPEVILKPGKYVYKFSRKLPMSLPSTYYGDHGYVLYMITVILDRPWRFNKCTTAAFRVISPLDLNLDSDNWLPASSAIKGPLQVKVSVPQTGYVPGEHIEITCDVQNNSSSDVRSIEFILRKKATYYCPNENNKRMGEKDIVTLKVEGVPKHSKQLMVNSIQVPATQPPSLLHNCRIIDVEYGLKIILHQFFSDQILEIPIKVGTLALENRLSGSDNSKDLQLGSQKYNGYDILTSRIHAPIKNI